jgi:hypothetical protein
MSLPVLITYSNYGFLNFAENLILNLIDKVKNHKTIFYCLDKKTHTFLSKKYNNQDLIRFVLMNTNVSENYQSYGTLEYNNITHKKIDILKHSIKKYNFIHFIDSDVVCIKEPDETHYEKYKNFDIVFQYDCGYMDGIKELHPLYNDWTCTGNTTFRNTEGTSKIFKIIEDYQRKNPNRNDQECLMDYFRTNGIIDIRNEPNAKLMVYPIEEYTNGYMINHKIYTLDKTYFFHANHMIGNIAKEYLLRDNKMWYL